MKSSSTFFLKSEQTPHGLCLPYFNSVQDGLTPRPVFAPESKYTVDLLHHSFAFHSPSRPSTSTCSHFASFFFQAILRPSCSTEGESNNLETLLELYSVLSCSGADQNVLHHLGCMSACPPKTCGFRFQTPHLCLLMLQVRL